MAQIASAKNIGCVQMIISPLCDDIRSCNFIDGCPTGFFEIPKFDQVINCQKATQIFYIGSLLLLKTTYNNFFQC